ncbi:MAG: hypothetical protein AB7V18_19365 [Pyrinomonadaceae bacterium]
MAKYCKTTQHWHLDDASADVCCNGYRRALRKVNEPKLEGELDFGAIYLSDREFYGYVSVWIPESKEP